ncbi:MAG TPA: penicillin-binding protein, partial [Lachnospiraceae bacterium]|nr:penicillin-binding protein [Lachnospiraceae bacterium]
NGKLLAYNKLAYSVTIEDNYESSSSKNARLNETILKTIGIVEDHGDKIISDFNIILNNNGDYEFTLSDSRLARFLADIYGYKTADELKYEERTATPEDVIAYLCEPKNYEIGRFIEDESGEKHFLSGDGYSREEILKLITVRYALSTNSYQKYLATVIAEDVSEETVAAIMENKDSLQGVGIEEELLRRYNETECMAHILGYVGNASQEDLSGLKESSHDYTITDTVGKAGVEKAMEEELQGVKGKDIVFTDNVGKVIETSEHIDPQAGNDVYLSIDSELQRSVYNLIEQKLAGILVSKIVNQKEYNNSEVKSSLMMIPIDDVYYALLNNNVIDINKFSRPGAHPYESKVYDSFVTRRDSELSVLKDELLSLKTPYRELPVDFQIYESYIVQRLGSSGLGIILSSQVNREDPVYISWAVDETISLQEYLMYCLSQDWIDIGKFNTEAEYLDSEEVYNKLVDYILEELREDPGFSKRVYKYMIRDNDITGRDICMLMFEQNVVYATAAEKSEVENGIKAPYDYMINKIANIEITPAQLALDPCSGSCVVMNMSGEVLACVTYPGYDANRLTNTIDSAYYARLMGDLSSPMYNNATQQMTAPGSTFKMVSTAAGLENGVINIGERLYCKGVYRIDSLDIEKTCWIYPMGHGMLDSTHAIEHSCNSFFYEVGYRLSTDLMKTRYNEKLGLEKLRKYADEFGLTEKTGIEMEENEPMFSDTLPIDSAIGQGSHNYTTIGLARYVNTIANGGNCYTLSLINRVESPEGEVIRRGFSSVRNRVELKASTWDSIRTGMNLVAQNTKSLKELSLTAAGKTGTAQTSKSRTNHALFLGYAPFDDPEISIAVRIAYGYTSANAASLASDVFKYYFRLEDTDTLLSGTADSEEQEIIED